METFLIMLGTFLVVSVSFLMGFKLGRQQRSETVPATKEQKDLAAKMQTAFQKIMNYDLDTAMGRGAIDE